MFAINAGQTCCIFEGTFGLGNKGEKYVPKNFPLGKRQEQALKYLLRLVVLAEMKTKFCLIDAITANDITNVVLEGYIPMKVGDRIQHNNSTLNGTFIVVDLEWVIEDFSSGVSAHQLVSVKAEQV